MGILVEELYLDTMPQTVLLGGLPSRGIAEHWTAGRRGRAGALSTIHDVLAGMPDRNASYHEVRYWERPTLGIIRIVRSTRAAHSINPKPVSQGGPYAPLAEVRRILGDRVNDPNAACYATSFAGGPADLEAALADPLFVELETEWRRRLLTEEDTIRVERPLFNHAWCQPGNKTDAGDRLIPAIYARLYGPQEDTMPTPPLHYVPQIWRAKDGGAELREQADLAAPVIATIPKGGIVFTVGENPSRIGWRLAVAGDPERLFYVQRSEIDPLPPTPRDPELYSGIATVVNARAAGQPVPIGGVPKVELEALQEEIGRLSGRIKAKDQVIAQYPKG